MLRLRVGLAYAEGGDRLRAFGERLAAVSDLDRAIAAEPEFAFALINRAIARRALAAHQRAGGVEEEARRGFTRAASDAERALELLPSDWKQRGALERLRRRERGDVEPALAPAPVSAAGHRALLAAGSRDRAPDQRPAISRIASISWWRSSR